MVKNIKSQRAWLISALCAIVDRATLATPENLIHNTLTTWQKISRKKLIWPLKCQVKEIPIRPCTWESCDQAVLLHIGLSWYICAEWHWKENFQPRFLVLGIVERGLLEGLQTVTQSWEFHINGSWYKQPIQVRNRQKKEIRKLHHDFFFSLHKTYLFRFCYHTAHCKIMCGIGDKACVTSSHVWVILLVFWRADGTLSDKQLENVMIIQCKTLSSESAKPVTVQCLSVALQQCFWNCMLCWRSSRL